MKICPAILTSNEVDFINQFINYSKYFEQIDIDVNIEFDIFPGKPTLSSSQVAELLEKYSSDKQIAIHLMVNSPLSEIAKYVKLQKPLKFYIHQEDNFDLEQILKLNELKSRVAVAVKAESSLKDIDFYNNFFEVQLMTIETGAQGNKFQPQVLEKAKQLKEMGYIGLIGIDGSVNLETAGTIKNFPIDRVSVGSYFSKSTDVTDAYRKLDEILNG